MTPKVTLRKALEDPDLLGSALAGPTWHAWRVILLAAMGEPLTKDELKTFTSGIVCGGEGASAAFNCYIGRLHCPSHRSATIPVANGRGGIENAREN